LKFKKIPIPLVVFWTKTKETDIKNFWPLEGVESHKLTQKFMILPIFFYNGNLLAFVGTFNNTHCHNKLNTQIEHQKYKSKGS